MIQVPAEEREGETGEEPGGEGGPHHREAELSPLRHDHPPRHRQPPEEPAGQKGAGVGAQQMGQRPPQVAGYSFLLVDAE